MSSVFKPRPDLLWWAIDLDQTLAEGLWSPENPTADIGQPLWQNVQKLGRVRQAGKKIVVHTSRGWHDYERIEEWLLHNDIDFDKIVPGKLLAHTYVDDRACHSDAETWL